MPENNKTDPDDSPKHDEDEKDSQRGLRMIIGVGIVVLLIVIIVGAAFVDSQKIRFITEFSLTVALATLVGVQAYIYRKQWDAMDASLDRTDQVIKTMKRQSEFTEESFHISSRAYVFVSEATLDESIDSGRFPLPKIILKNSGKTPAYNYRIRVEQAFLFGEADKQARKGIMPDMRPLSKEGFTIIGPGEFINMHLDRKLFETREDRERAIAGESTFYVWGVIRYWDVFKQPHSCKFSLWAKTPQATQLSFGMFGNDIEGNEEE